MIETQISQLAAANHRGGGRCDSLYGSSSPALNLAVSRARQMAPDERHDAGWRDGFANRGMLGSMSDYPDYVEGWGKGYRARF